MERKDKMNAKPLSDVHGIISDKELCTVCKAARRLSGITKCILCLREHRKEEGGGN